MSRTGQDVHLWLGADFSQKKLQQTTKPVILGVEYNLEEMFLEVTAARAKELDLEMEGILRTQRLTPGQAGKLKGKLMFAASQLWGKVGRAFMRALSERQYSKEKRVALNPAIRGALEAWRSLLKVAPRRRLEQTDNDLVDLVIFTDGYFPDARKAETDPARVGGVVFAREGNEPPEFFSTEVPADTMRKWIPRTNQIALVGLFSPVLALELMGEKLRGKKVLLTCRRSAGKGVLSTRRHV